MVDAAHLRLVATMPEARVDEVQKAERRLSAIFAADAAGYSRLMVADEPLWDELEATRGAGAGATAESGDSHDRAALSSRATSGPR